MRKIFALIVMVLVAGISSSWAAEKAERGTKEEAIAMVKKAIAFIKANGNDKAFEEFNNRDGQFVDRDLYVIVYDMNGVCMAHGGNIRKVGRELIDDKDADGKPFMRERIELMKKQASAWQDYKYKNFVTNQIEAKSTYLEKSGDLIVGCGIYAQ